MEHEIEQKLGELAITARRVPFFALVHHLARLFPSAPAVGGLGPASAEILRFRHDVQPIFHASDVTELRLVRRGGELRVEVTTGFLGVVGSVSPLASFLTEDVLRAEAEDEHSLRAFYDLFHHRLIAFVYGAQVRAAPELEVRGDGSDRVTRRSAALTGGPAAGQGGLTRPQWTGLARVVGRRPHSRLALEAALRLAFPGVGIQLVDFVSRDVNLPRSERAQLGVRNVTLGRGARLGSRLLRQTGLIRLVVGPLDRSMLQGFLPGGPDHARLRATVNAVTGGMLDVEADLEVKQGEEPRARLGGRHGATLGVSALVARPAASRGLRLRVSLTGAAAGKRLAFEVLPA